ncbi:hypothetical protein ACQHIV_26545 [Kribbella sp. GL6]|uniref:hypothetical protein n=1 Tax=Kribbella sp. GL6 TaxID=3419765 RepID=UPI003D002B55
MSHAEQLGRSIDALIAAFDENDSEAYARAGQQLVEAAQQTSPEVLDRAVGRLVPLVADIHPARGAGLARLVGSMVGTAGTSAPQVVPTLVERACEVMEQALAFVASYREIFGAEPDRDDETVVERYLQAADERGIERPDRYAAAWELGESWVQPVLFLCQRADVRRTLPQRERLRPLVEQVEDLFPGVAPWLLGLLRVLDDEPLIVVHRESGQVFRATMTGVADNFQLHTLLAAKLLGPSPRRGLFARRRSTSAYLPGEAPTAAMIAAADGSGELMPPGGVVGRFNLVDANGAWIWNEGRPDEIPVVRGARVVVLDPPAYERSWNTGRVYPLMTATMDVEPVSEPEAAQWRSVVSPAEAGTGEELVVTDDLSVPLPPGRTVADVVDLVLGLVDRGASADEVEGALGREFGLNADDAALARDRVFGGLVRAATKNPANAPSPVKDPIAHESYRRGVADPGLVRKHNPDLDRQ